MKAITLFLLTGTLLVSIAHVQSQSPAAETASPAAILTSMKAQNEDTLAKQNATLEKLDDLAETANQIKIFGKRG